MSEPKYKLVPVEPGKLWSWIARVLGQGAAIQQDYAAGKYETYEHYSARIDEAARERADQFMSEFAAPSHPQDPRDEALRVAREALESVIGEGHSEMSALSQQDLVLKSAVSKVRGALRQIKELMGEK